ncbi:MAG: transglutaminaseTgpA domain-containing protein [Bacillota bacterium]
MSPNDRRQWDNAFGIMVYVTGFILYLLWLQPLISLEVVAFGEVLVLFSAVIFLLNILRLPLILSLLFKVIAALFVLDDIYLTESILTRAWFSELYRVLRFNIEVLISRDFDAVTPLFEMLLILLLIMTISYLMDYWLVKRQRVFIFSALTLIYLTVMDTFTPYELEPMIIATIVLVVSMLVLNSHRKKLKEERLTLTGGQFFLRLLVPLALIFALFIAVADDLPVKEPKWPDPVPFLTSGFSSGETNRRIGYGEDDSVLGGSLRDNDALVFTASIDAPNYWRVDAKEVYTGIGWERKEEPDYRPYRNTEGALGRQMVELYYNEETDFNRIAYPYNLSGLTYDGREYSYDQRIGLFDTIDTMDNQRVNLYFEPPVYEQTILDALEMSYENIDPVYTQLPTRVPDRVHQLANEIKGEETNPYQIAQRMERYFKQGNFRYQTTEVAQPEAGEDYVDQFLFESQSGYCDNFSTSMVVMLRSVGIPARWVKGFNTGTENSEGYYEVRQNNAHSWVEVYFDGVGWLPFEPTIGFSSPRHVVIDESDMTEDDQPLDSDQALEEETDTPEAEQEPEETEEVAVEEVGENSQSQTVNGQILFIVFGILSSLAVVLLAVFWRQVLLFIMTKRYLPITTEKDVTLAMRRLFWLLRLRSHERLSGETLTVYGQRLDQIYETNGFSNLFHAYERYLYGKSTDSSTIQAIEKFFLFALKSILS